MENANSADRLRSIIDGIIEAQGDLAGGKRVGLTSLAEALPFVAKSLDFSDYLEFASEFTRRVDAAKRDVELLSLRRENVRGNALEGLDEIHRLFDASNFGTRTDQVINRSFSQRNLNVVDDLSERFDAQNFAESSLEHLQASLKTAKEVIKLVESSSELSEKAARLIKVHIDHLNTVTETYGTMGEQDFWAIYRQLYATFSQLHEEVVGPEKPQVGEKLKTMMGRIITGSSLAANVVTLGPPAAQLLLGSS